LIRLLANHPEWLLGFEDEVWWSRLAHPSLHAWREPDHSLRLVQQHVGKEDPDPKALACYGLLVRGTDPEGAAWEQTWLRFVDGRPVSGVTTQFLSWCLEKTQALGKRALLLVWDNASWHISQEVRGFIRRHNRQVKQTGQGVRVVNCYLPSKSPWLNPIEPKWVHGKRRVVEPERLLTSQELAQRVCTAFDHPYEPHLSITEKVA
jgi:DDE superfamily endonuclease